MVLKATLKYVMGQMRAFEMQELYFQKLVVDYMDVWQRNRSTEPKPIDVVHDALGAYRRHMRELLLRCVVPDGRNTVGSIAVGKKSSDGPANEKLVQLAVSGWNATQKMR